MEWNASVDVIVDVVDVVNVVDAIDVIAYRRRRTCSSEIQLAVSVAAVQSFYSTRVPSMQIYSYPPACHVCPWP